MVVWIFLVFSRKKLVFLPKTIFFLGKNWFFHAKTGFPSQNHLFPRENQKTILLESGRMVSQQMVVLVFPRNSWFLIGGHSVAVDYVLTSNLNELTDTSC